ncbi:M24 family metallopeptidase [Chloroflexota bacterium]
MNSRLEKLRLKLATMELDAFIFSQPKNRSYLSSVSSSDGYLIVSQNDAVLAVDGRYSEWASRKASPSSGIRVVLIHGEMQKWMPDLIASMNISTLGFEDIGLTYSIYSKIVKALDSLDSKVELTPTNNIIGGLRAVKDSQELKSLQEAATVADSAFERMRQQMKAGMTEKEVAWLLERLLRENGSSAVPFAVIVASGPNAAFPHHSPSNRPICEGDPVIIDFGARIKGYGSDITRTLCLGKPDDKFREIYSVLMKAQQQAIDKIRSGMTGKQADAIARGVIADAGYGQYFMHALGHGTGLEVHEEPRLGENSEDLLSDGMVFTIEPGIYIPGWGGIRIEDMVVLEESKAHVMTHTSK